jgi:hypothetical protein
LETVLTKVHEPFSTLIDCLLRMITGGIRIG